MFKKLSLATALLAASVSIASAGGTLSNFIASQHDAGQVTLGTVTADGPGVVEVYSYHAGQQGALLGSEAVHAGANLGVSINVPNGEDHVIAVLSVNGAVADTQEIVIE